ncbi:MAG: uracil-DNA glycosylase [Bdellovibrionota bacterium]
MDSLKKIQAEIIACQRCPRLISHCRKVAMEKRAAYAEEKYWGLPVPSWGDPKAKLVIVGLAPAAHGANRTGRMFTGDRSGEWLYRALHKAGFANQAEAVSATDGLKLLGAWISATAHCAPPDNKPLPEEIGACAEYLVRELAALRSAKVYLALGKIAMDGLWPKIAPGEKRPKFGHGKEAQLQNGRTLLLSYHPSQQNTFTKRLTEPMFDRVFNRANELINEG